MQLAGLAERECTHVAVGCSLPAKIVPLTHFCRNNLLTSLFIRYKLLLVHANSPSANQTAAIVIQVSMMFNRTGLFSGRLVFLPVCGGKSLVSGVRGQDRQTGWRPWTGGPYWSFTSLNSQYWYPPTEHSGLYMCVNQVLLKKIAFQGLSSTLSKTHNLRKQFSNKLAGWQWILIKKKPSTRSCQFKLQKPPACSHKELDAFSQQACGPWVTWLCSYLMFKVERLWAESTMSPSCTSVASVVSYFWKYTAKTYTDKKK